MTFWISQGKVVTVNR